MNIVRFELIELPYLTLARFGLTQEMIEDLPMRVEKPLNFDPFGHAELSLFAKI